MRRYPSRRQAGLTLVELMVATTLSLVLLAGVLLVFSANKTTYRMQSGLGTLQENGRYAMHQIASDLQLAGFGGCLSPHLNPKPRVINLVTPSAPVTDYLDNFTAGEFFSGSNNGSGGPFDNRNVLAGTDSIEIRGPLRSPVGYVTGETVATSAVIVKGAIPDFGNGAFYLISDCAGTDVFRATSVTVGASTQLDHASGGSGNTQADLSRNFASDSVVAQLSRHVYFVSDTGRTNAANEPITALYRFDGANAVELVDGVENLQIEYALESGSPGQIDFKDAGAMNAADWGEVVAIRISLLLNSIEAANTTVAPYTYFGLQSLPFTPVPGDFRLRQEFSSVVFVRNAVQ